MYVRDRAGPFAGARGVSGEVIPSEIKDAVELWARQWGRHGTVTWNPWMKCPVIELTLKPDDPRLRGWKEGRVTREPRECIPLHYQPRDAKGNAEMHFVGMNLAELGVSGVIEILNRGNMQSGRGEYADMMTAVRSVAERNEKLREDMRNTIRDNSRERAKDMRRQIFDLPLVSVPADLEST
jgi:hypothetical protein